MKAIIFPINNKGGVGKTSVLTDLLATLSRGYTTAVVDFDYQASLAGTLLRDHSLGSRPLETYDSLETRTIVLQEGTSFAFSDAMRRLTIEVQPSQTRVAVFPVGMLYHKPERRTKLEHIVRDDFRDTQIIGVDLPPVPDPALILDHSVKPLVELAGDVTVFPIVVTTTEHNTIEIGLEQFKHVYAYLRALPSVKAIHPLLLVNKVQAEWPEDRTFLKGIAYSDAGKLQDMGLMEKGTRHAPIKDAFERDGIAYHVAWLPHFPHLREGPADGRFSFYFGAEPALFHFPELFAHAVKERYITEGDIAVDEILFVKRMQEMAAFFTERLGQPPREFYTMRTERKNIAEVQSRLVASMEEGQRRILAEWQADPDPMNYKRYNTYSIDEVIVKEWGVYNGHYTFTIPGPALPPEVMVDAIYDTMTEIYTKKGEQVAADYKERIRRNLMIRKPDSIYPCGFDDGHSGVHNIRINIGGINETALWEIAVELLPRRSSPSHENMNREFPLDQTMGVFLRNLNNALQAYQGAHQG